MHYHGYTSRVPGHQANGGPESEPGHPAFSSSTVPPRVTRRWLLRNQAKIGAKSFDTLESAVGWLATWAEDNPRPDGYYFPGETPGAQKARRLEHARHTLAGGDDVVHGHYSGGGEYLSAYVIACPPRDGKWSCPKP